MGVALQEVVDHIRKASRGLAHFDLARLNLKLRRPVSRIAMTLPDDPELVEAAWRAAREILNEKDGGAP
jgi:hypothetical protein